MVSLYVILTTQLESPHGVIFTRSGIGAQGDMSQVVISPTSCVRAQGGTRSLGSPFQLERGKSKPKGPHKRSWKKTQQRSIVNGAKSR